MPPIHDDPPSSPASTVAAIPEGARFVTRDEVRAMLDDRPAPSIVMPAPAIQALRGIEAAARVDASVNVLTLGIILIATGVVLWKLRD